MPIRISGTRFVYFPVPKVACTSIKTGILNHNEPATAARIEALANPKELNVHIVYPSYDFRPLVTRARWPFCQWVCVVRDPVKRAVSGYRNRILHHRDLEKTPKGALERLGLSPEPDLNSFAINLAGYSSLNKDVSHHFAPHSRFLGTRPERFAHIFKLGELDLLRSLVEEDGVALAFPHEQAEGPKLSVDDLSSEGRAALERFYAEDYRNWGPYFD